MHGGAARQNKAAAAARIEEASVVGFVARYGLPQDIDPHEAALEGLRETYGNVLALRDLVNRLAPDALVWGETEVIEVAASQFPGVNVTKAAGIRPTVELYAQERDRLHRISTDLMKLGIALRVEQRTNEIGEWMLDRMLGLATVFGLDPAAPETIDLVSHVLRHGTAPKEIA